MGKSEKQSKYDRRDHETPEERERRKEAKKAEKLAKVLGYSNDINPFGDSNLLQPFVWGKKKEKEKLSNKRGENDNNKSNEEPDKKRVKLIHEIEKVRKRRADREAELEEMQRLRDEEQRLRESAQFDDWQQKEEKFSLEQTRHRSKIRLVENREKPIDVIAKNILIIDAATAYFHSKQGTADGDSSSSSSSINAHSDEYKKDAHLLELDGEMRDPLDVISELYLDEVEELVEDVKAYYDLEHSKTHSPHVQFWEALLKVVKAELSKRKQLQKFGSAGHRSFSSSCSAAASSATVTATAASTTMHDSIAKDVAALLKGKSVSELDDLESDIDKNLREGMNKSTSAATVSGGDVEYWELLKGEVVLQRARKFVHDSHIKLLKQQLELLSQLRADAKAGADAAAAEAVHEHGDDEGGPEGERGTDGERTADAFKTLESGDREEKMQNNDEVMLPTATYWWQDKYRPRKPRYFNRVRTGWFRTKYNLSHYDHDNPPPKMIQGYKFTVFYPDLIDKTKTPQYFVERCDEASGGSDFVIIRFHAGPPYEDIAFKIINKEWDTHRRHGFLSVFDRGVLQLNFNFKQNFYRR